METKKLIVKLKNQTIPEEIFGEITDRLISENIVPKVDRLFDFAKKIDQRNLNGGYSILKGKSELTILKETENKALEHIDDDEVELFKTLLIEFDSNNELKNTKKYLEERTDMVEYVENDILFRLTQNEVIEIDKVEDKKYWGRNVIDVQQAHKLSIFGENILIALLDTGIDFEHPQLRKKIFIPPGLNNNQFIAENRDTDGHGTHVAGIIVSDEYGVAPMSKILPINIYGEIEGNKTWYSNVVNKMDFAIRAGARVINNSWEPLYCDTLPDNTNEGWAMTQILDLADRKGVVSIFAAGNCNKNISNVFPNNSSKVISVAAVTSDLGKLDISNFGNPQNLSAPGRDICSCKLKGSFEFRTGTSMAAPYASGLVALILSEAGMSNRKYILDKIKRNGILLNDPRLGTLINVGKCFTNNYIA